MNETIQRRRFIKNAAVGAPVVLSALNKTGYSANDVINIGCLGTGGRCQQLMRNLTGVPGVRLAAVCDLWDNHLSMAKNIADPNAFATRRYEEILERQDIDAVLIGSPDHLHVPMTVDACNAGKDVYVEKPLTHDLSEGKVVIDAQNNNKRIVQVGMQQRSMPHIQKAYEIMQSGLLGQVFKVHLTWNRNSPTTSKRSYGITPNDIDWKRFLGNAKDQPFDEHRFRNWRFFWDFGGGLLTDLMVHYLDVAHWFCGVDHPATAASIGDMIAAKGVWETPDTIQTLLHYPERELQIYYEGTFSNARNAAMMEFMGTEATLYMDRGRYEIHPEPNSKVKYDEWILGGDPRGADFYSNPNGGLLHLTNWIECMRSRKAPNAPAETGVSAAAGAHLGNIAYKKMKVAKWEEEYTG